MAQDTTQLTPLNLNSFVRGLIFHHETRNKGSEIV